MIYEFIRFLFVPKEQMKKKNTQERTANDDGEGLIKVQATDRPTNTMKNNNNKGKKNSTMENVMIKKPIQFQCAMNFFRFLFSLAVEFIYFIFLVKKKRNYLEGKKTLTITTAPPAPTNTNRTPEFRIFKYKLGAIRLNANKCRDFALIARCACVRMFFFHF